MKPEGMTNKKYKQILKFIKDYDEWKDGGWKPNHKYMAPTDYGLAIGEIEQVRKLLKMKPEPLKGKGILKAMYNPKGEYNKNTKLHYDEDIKSAAEGCLEEVLEECSTYEDGDLDLIKEIFKKWFEDVI